MNISPQQTIPVSYVVLPTDSTTYYVQAVLRDTRSGAILQTINLKQNATYTYRYTGLFNAVSDPSGLGRYIDITVIPYTDSGHTTPSQNYAALLLNYVVLQQWIPTLGAGGGGSIDYEKLRETIVEVVEENAKSVRKGLKKLPKTEVDYKRIEALIDGVGENFGQQLTKHTQGVQKMFDTHSKLMTSANIAKSLEDEERFSRIEQSLSMLPTVHEDSLTTMRKELMDSISMTKKELMEMHEHDTKALDKKYEDSFTKHNEELKEYIGQNLSEKEIKFKFGEMPKEKKEKIEPQIDPRVLKLLGV